MPSRAIARANRVDLVRAGLLHHLQSGAELFGQHPQPVGDDLRQDRRPLAAAGHQHPEDAVCVEVGIGSVAERQHLVAHRIADGHHPVAHRRGHPLGVGRGGGDCARRAGDQTVDAAQHGILLVQHDRHAQRLRGEHGGERGIAAEAHHRRRALRPHQPARQPAPLPHGRRRLQHGDRTFGQPPGGQHMDRHVLEQPRNARPALVGHQRHRVPAPAQFLGERMGGHHVAARAPGGQQIVAAVSHQLVHVTR